MKPIKEISSHLHEENIVPEKLSSITFRNSTKILNDSSFVKLTKNERPILLFNTQTKSSLSNITNKNTINKKQDLKIPIKRKKSNDSVYESHSSSKMKKISSNENVTPSLLVNQRNNSSNSSLNSWRTLRDTRNYEENNFSAFNFFSSSTTLEGNREKLKNQIKKAKQLPNNLKTAQGDIEVKLLNDNQIFVKNDKIQNDNEYEANRKKIFFDVINILIGVKSTLFENRKLVKSIQRHFQNCSIFHTIISDDAVTLLNEGISRYRM